MIYLFRKAPGRRVRLLEKSGEDGRVRGQRAPVDARAPEVLEPGPQVDLEQVLTARVGELGHQAFNYT